MKSQLVEKNDKSRLKRVTKVYVGICDTSFICRYIKEGSTVSVIGVVQRNDNVLMIVPTTEPLAAGWQWSKCTFPASLEGIVLRCEDSSNVDAIPV